MMLILQIAAGVLLGELSIHFIKAAIITYQQKKQA